MENESNVDVTNENNVVEKKPSVFKTICSFIGFGIGAWLFFTIATGGFDDEVRDIEQSVTDVTQGKTTVEEAVNTFVAERTEKDNSSTFGYKPEITWNDYCQAYTMWVEPLDTTESEPYETILSSDWMMGKSCYMMDNYVVDYGNASISEIYSCIDSAYNSYINGYNYFDLRGIDAVENINGLMRENDYQMEIIIEGQIISVEGQGNVIQIFDMSTTEENVYKYDNGINSADLNCYVDISMLDNKDEYFVNDNVTIYARYCGRIPTQNGSYQPLIVAVAMELQ